jgi:hypothetical protein
VKEQRDRLDDREVRNARALVRALRGSSPPDIVAFGDSNWVFWAPYDEDPRSLGALLGEELGAGTSLHVCCGAGYHALLIAELLRLVADSGRRPVIVLPLCVRMAESAWRTHPNYAYDAPAAKIASFRADTPLWRMRAPAPEPTPADWARYESQVISTWAGTGPIAELREPLRDPRSGLDETQRRRLLYAYHHGERLEPTMGSVQEVVRMGRALRSVGAPAVVFETTIPVDEGEALWGSQFRANAEHNLAVLRDALLEGYGEPLEILRTGVAFARDEFVDPADGTEHLNERGRRHMAGLLAAAVRAARQARPR